VNLKVRKVLDNVGLKKGSDERVELSVNTKRRVREKAGRSECKFRLIIRLRITCQVSTAYILLDVLVL